MKYKLVIFDFDGTLADSLPWLLSMMDHIAEKYHFDKADQNEIDLIRSMDATQILKRYRIPFWMLPAMVSYVLALMADNIHHITLFDGVERLLKSLSSQGITLGLVTSNSFENASRVLGPELMALIQYHECGVSILGKAPKIKRVLKSSGILAAETISIGDEIRDIDAAREAGVACGAVAWGYTRVEALTERSPDLVFTDIAEIEAKVNGKPAGPTPGF